jgi:hypothetical protein
VIDETMKDPVMKIDDKNEAGQQPPTEASEPKQPYVRPMLVNLGSLRDMTTRLTAAGHADGGKRQHTGRGGLNGLGSRLRG